MLKSACLVAVGALIGGATAYILMNRKEKQLVDKYEGEIDRILHEKERMKNSFQREIDNLVEEKRKRVLADQNDYLKSNMDINSPKEEVTYEITGTDEEVSDSTHAYSRKPAKKEYMDEKYNSRKAMMDKYESELEDYCVDDEDDEDGADDDDSEDGYIPTYPKEGPSEEPYGITPDMFMSEHHLDKVTLIWWEDEGILVTEDDVDMTNELKNTVGYAFDDFFDVYEFDEAYIRNDMNGTDYQIIRKFGSYKMEKEFI